MKDIINSLPELQKLHGLKSLQIHQNVVDNHEQKELRSAMDLNRKLSVNANKFKTSKYLQLFDVLEKDEQNVVADDIGNEDAETTGTENF